MNGVRIFSNFILKQGYLTSKMVGSSHVKVLMYLLHGAETKAPLICSSTNQVKRVSRVSRLGGEYGFMKTTNKALLV